MIPLGYCFPVPSQRLHSRSTTGLLEKSQDFNEASYEKNRLEKDAQAMGSMKEIAENEFSKLRTPWKWVIRKRIWDMMEEKELGMYDSVREF